MKLTTIKAKTTELKELIKLSKAYKTNMLKFAKLNRVNSTKIKEYLNILYKTKYITVNNIFNTGIKERENFKISDSLKVIDLSYLIFGRI